MIIKGVFRRYERWNPVHPTSGAFWGLGIGIGCGVGWGPGFGPEVIGYVGAGCGVGFSVGFTLLGVGIGLPANWLYTVPYEAVMAARSTALKLGRPPGIAISRSMAAESWDKIAPCVTGLQREAGGRLFDFKQNLVEGFESIDVKSQLSANTKNVCDGLTAFGERVFHFPRDRQQTSKAAMEDKNKERIRSKNKSKME